MAYSNLFSVILILSACLHSKLAFSQQFLFNGFTRTTELRLNGASISKPNGLLRLTNTTRNTIGHAFYSEPINTFNRTTSTASSFSSTFVFSIAPPSSGKGGFGLAFVFSPSPEIPGASAGHFLGLFNESSNNQTSNHIFAVEFDTVNGANEGFDRNGNHVGININEVNSIVSEPASYTINNTRSKEEVDLHEGKPIQAWVEYDGANKVVNVTICPVGLEKPIVPLISFSYDLTAVLKETMFVGFSASTGEKASSHYILGWSFSTTGDSPALNVSALPIPPPTEKDSSGSFPGKVVALIIGLCAVTVILVGILLGLMFRRWFSRFETLEGWELECPHRFRYNDLYSATKGFKETEIVGVGGFGTVYKAVLPNGNLVAVKKIARNSTEGFKEFSAEIESLGRVRHKHLVNLQGWCKNKNNLFLVYDYIQFGSLDNFLFNPKNDVILTWDQRFKIVKGIAAGLLYLHEEWEQVVIHRDVKSSNVLIDGEMNGRLGDFGLARLYDHGTNSHTTNVVGTIGYISPEMARTGKASTSSDVFAYGVLLLEISTGRRPVESGHFILADWVMEYQQMGRIVDVVDPKLGSKFEVKEMELVLELGLVCSHPVMEVRPSMRQVTRYLNGDDKLCSKSLCGISSRLSNVSSSFLDTTSPSNTSVTFMSTTSIDAGR